MAAVLLTGALFGLYPFLLKLYADGGYPTQQDTLLSASDLAADQESFLDAGDNIGN